MKKLLVTGASGFLGWNLCQLAQANWSDPVCPINYYGEQKAIAEQKMREIYPAIAQCRMPLM